MKTKRAKPVAKKNPKPFTEPTATIECGGRRVVVRLGSKDPAVSLAALHALQAFARLLSWRFAHGEPVGDWTNMNHSDLITACAAGVIAVEEQR